MSVVLLEGNCPGGCQEKYTEYGLVNRLHPCGHFICPWCYSANNNICPTCSKLLEPTLWSRHFLFKENNLPLPLPSTIKHSTAEEKKLRLYACVADPPKRAKDDALEEKCPKCARNYMDVGKGVFRFHPCGHFTCCDCSKLWKGVKCPTCKKTVTGWEYDSAYMGDLKLQLQQRQQEEEHLASLSTVENLKGGEFEQKQQQQHQQQQQQQKLNCSLCSEDIRGIASLCTTCLDEKYPDWKRMDGLDRVLDSEAICSDCRVDHNEGHLFKKLLRVKNELHSETYEESVNKKLNDSISKLSNATKTDLMIMETMKTSLLNTVTAMKNSDSSGIEEDLREALDAHDEVVEKFFRAHDELYLAVENANSSLTKYSPRTSPQKENKSVSSEISSPPPPYALHETTPIPPIDSSDPVIQGGPKKPFFHFYGTDDLHGISMHETAKIYLENITDKTVQMGCNGALSNFSVTPSSAVIAPSESVTLSCRRDTNDPDRANMIFIKYRPTDEDTTRILIVPIKTK